MWYTCVYSIRYGIHPFQGMTKILIFKRLVSGKAVVKGSKNMKRCGQARPQWTETYLKDKELISFLGYRVGRISRLGKKKIMGYNCYFERNNAEL